MRTDRSLTVCRSLLPGGVCLLRGVVSALGGVVSQHALRQTPPPPVNRMTNRCKNITLTTTSLQPLITPQCAISDDNSSLNTPVFDWTFLWELFNELNRFRTYCVLTLNDVTYLLLSPASFLASFFRRRRGACFTFSGRSLLSRRLPFCRRFSFSPFLRGFSFSCLPSFSWRFWLSSCGFWSGRSRFFL